MAKFTQDELNKLLWSAADSARGTVDAAVFKDYMSRAKIKTLFRTTISTKSLILIKIAASLKNIRILPPLMKLKKTTLTSIFRVM